MQPDPRAVAEAMMRGDMSGGLPPMGGAPAMGMGEGAPPGMEPPMPSAGADPSMGMPSGMGSAPFPSIDPMVIAGLVTQIKGLQEQDLASLQSQQDVVLAAVVQALGGAGPDPTMGVTEGAAFGAPEGPPMGEAPMSGPPAMGAPVEGEY